jgi:ABC-type uncharacterized transport system substrate-binding protein
LPGQRPAQLARCPAVGKPFMSTPISAIRTSAVRRRLDGWRQIPAVLREHRGFGGMMHPPLGEPGNVGAAALFARTREAARALGLHVRPRDVMETADLDPTFAAVQRDGGQAVLVQSAAWMIPWRTRIALLARERRLPLISDWYHLTQAGGLLSYRWDDNQLLARAAALVDRILKGTNPAAVPIERATTFRLVVNLKTSKALGLAISPTVLARADEIIE